MATRQLKKLKRYLGKFSLDSEPRLIKMFPKSSERLEKQQNYKANQAIKGKQEQK